MRVRGCSSYRYLELDLDLGFCSRHTSHRAVGASLAGPTIDSFFFLFFSVVRRCSALLLDFYYYFLMRLYRALRGCSCSISAAVAYFVQAQSCTSIAQHREPGSELQLKSRSPVHGGTSLRPQISPQASLVVPDMPWISTHWSWTHLKCGFASGPQLDSQLP